MEKKYLEAIKLIIKALRGKLTEDEQKELGLNLVKQDKHFKKALKDFSIKDESMFQLLTSAVMGTMDEETQEEFGIMDKDRAYKRPKH